MSTLTYSELRDAVAGVGVGVRARTVLEPLGGPGSKVSPPTYGDAADRPTKYATERRRVPGRAEPVESVLLDSVASQANRFELALLEAFRRGELALPVVSTDFRDADGAEDLGLVSSLQAPHRIFDALLRDSLLDGVLFRMSKAGQAITEASARNAGALFRYSPHTLLFGGWDSTGPKGGRGSKFERAITSEIVGLGVEVGVRTASRLDPAGIEVKAGPLFEDADGEWTLDEAQAVRTDKGQPKLYARGADKSPGRPSHANHGNVLPVVKTDTGGVTVEEIVATTVLSFIQLRRLRFPFDSDGLAIEPGVHADAEAAARTALAALGLASAVLAFEEGFDLRSGCVLFSEQSLRFDLVPGPGRQIRPFGLERSEALALVEEAVSAAARFGLRWESEEVLLRPAHRLAELVRRSRRIAAAGSAAVVADS